MLLAAGHDGQAALAICATLLPAAQQQALLAAQPAEDSSLDELLAFFSPFARTLLRAGQHGGDG